MFRFLSQILFSVVLIVLSLVLIAGGYWYINIHAKQKAGNLHISNFDIQEKIVIYSVNDDFLYDLYLKDKDNERTGKYVALQGGRILFVVDMSKAQKKITDNEEVWEVPINIEIHRDPAKRVINDVVINDSDKKLIEALDKFSEQNMKYRVVHEGLLQKSISTGQDLIKGFIEQAYLESGQAHKPINVILRYSESNFDSNNSDVITARAYQVNTRFINADWNYNTNSIHSLNFESLRANNVSLGKLYLETLGYNQGKMAQQCKNNYIAKIFDPVSGEKGRFYYLQTDGAGGFNICFSTDDGFLHQVRYEWQGLNQIPAGLSSAIMVAMNITHDRKRLLSQLGGNEEAKLDVFTLNGIYQRDLEKQEAAKAYLMAYLNNFSKYFSFSCDKYEGVKSNQIICLPHEYQGHNEYILKYLKYKQASINGMSKEFLYGNAVFISFRKFSKPRLIERNFLSSNDVEGSRFDELLILNVSDKWPFNTLKALYWDIYHPDCIEASGSFKEKCSELPNIYNYDDLKSRINGHSAIDLLDSFYIYSNIKE